MYQMHQSQVSSFVLQLVKNETQKNNIFFNKEKEFNTFIFQRSKTIGSHIADNIIENPFSVECKSSITIVTDVC